MESRALVGGEKMKKSLSKKIFDVCNCVILILFSISIIYPILNQFALSFSSSSAILQENVTIWPKGFTLDTYDTLFRQDKFWLNYLNTIIYTTLGTIIGLVMTTLCSYALSKELVGGSTFMKLIVFTIFFGGGLIPNYALISNLDMVDTIWALIIPNAILPYHVLIMRTYFMGLPHELEEAAKLDGMGQFGYFMKIAIPLSKPIIATMILFIAVIYWNDWFAALIYINDADMQPVTLYLRNLMMGAQTAAQSGEIGSTIKTIPQCVQAASMIVVTLPVVCIYPFVQKHFVKGVMVGSVKG